MLSVVVTVSHNSNSNSSIVPISLTKSSSEVQQTKSFGVIINGDMQKLLEHGTDENLLWKSNVKQIYFQFFFFYERWL